MALLRIQIQQPPQILMYRLWQRRIRVTFHDLLLDGVGGVDGHGVLSRERGVVTGAVAILALRFLPATAALVHLRQAGKRLLQRLDSLTLRVRGGGKILRGEG